MGEEKVKKYSVVYRVDVPSDKTEEQGEKEALEKENSAEFSRKARIERENELKAQSHHVEKKPRKSKKVAIAIILIVLIILVIVGFLVLRTSIFKSHQKSAASRSSSSAKVSVSSASSSTSASSASSSSSTASSEAVTMPDYTTVSYGCYWLQELLEEKGVPASQIKLVQGNTTTVSSQSQQVYKVTPAAGSSFDPATTQITIYYYVYQGSIAAATTTH